MAESILIDKDATKEAKYEQILPQIKALIELETDRTANLANVAAVLKEVFNFLWVGFYEWKTDELVLGPFQGPIACTRIKSGRGVCGTSFETAKTIIVPNVDEFPGHIACSNASKSEIVVPILRNGKVLAVLDADSDELNDFDKIDQKYLEQLAILIAQKW
ncbi:MAG: GAF domain-containing protein [Vicingaceae bacterium]|jgi:GAF domain-containing protein